MIWTIGQTRRVMGLRVTQVAAANLAAAADPDGIRECVRRTCAGMLADAAHVHGVDLDERDVQVRESDEPFGVRFDARWWPETKTIELAGGELDGKLLDYPGAPHMPLVTPVLPFRTLFANDRALALAPLPVGTVVWRCTGWSETDRHWIYTMNGEGL